METYDVIVVGLGAMGAAATYQLAKSGAKVLGIDQFNSPHGFGSSHGDTRITRRAIGEGPEYVELVGRSNELWREIETESGMQLLEQTGALLMSVSNPRSVHGVSDFVSQTASIAQQFAIAHQRFTSAEIQSRFSAFQLQDSTSGYLEPEGGYLRPERCIEAQLSLAQRQGAMLQMNEQVIEWQSEGSSVVVRTDKATYHAEKIIVTAGPWMNDLVPGFTDKIKVYRQVLYWFELESQAWYERYRDMPVYVWIFGPQNGDMVYGFPAVDGLRGGLKLAAEDYSVTTTPQTLNREVSQAEIASFYARYVQPNFKGLTSKSLQAQACMYTVTPQHKFLIDFHPQHPNVLVASPCSGHGFKHSAAIGEMLAQLATTGRSVIDAKPFGFEYL